MSFCRLKTFYNYLIFIKAKTNVYQILISIFFFGIIPIKVLKKTLKYIFLKIKVNNKVLHNQKYFKIITQELSQIINN